MNMQEFIKNRQLFPLEELAKYRGQWIAWSPDGTRIVAASDDPEKLVPLVRSAGENPEECLIQGVPDADSIIGA